MIKVGIVTIFDRKNFGNRLQNYAAQTVLRRMGISCKTLVHAGKYYPSAKARVVLWGKALVCKALGYRLATNHTSLLKRYHVDHFNRFIDFDPVACKNYRFPESLRDRYDCFVTGSDQVWNPYFWKSSMGNEDDGFSNNLLCFARPEQRKCLSPSISLQELPSEWNERFRDAWLTYRDLGVREKEGAALIERLTGRTDVVQTIDPTLMLDAEDWQKVARVNKGRPKGKYALYMFLGAEPEEIPAEKQQYLSAMLERTQMQALRMNDRAQPAVNASGPSEFIDLIQHADLVITDSFHCVVFAFLFDKPFLLFTRHAKQNIDMSSRTDTLLSMLALERKQMDRQVWDDEHIFEHDYAISREKLLAARQALQTFLEKSFR